MMSTNPSGAEIRAMLDCLAAGRFISTPVHYTNSAGDCVNAFVVYVLNSNGTQRGSALLLEQGKVRPLPTTYTYEAGECCCTIGLEQHVSDLENRVTVNEGDITNIFEQLASIEMLSADGSVEITPPDGSGGRASTTPLHWDFSVKFLNNGINTVVTRNSSVYQVDVQLPTVIAGDSHIIVTPTTDSNGKTTYTLTTDATPSNTVSSNNGTVVINSTTATNGSTNYDLSVIPNNTVSGNDSTIIVTTTTNANGSQNYDLKTIPNPTVVAGSSETVITVTPTTNSDSSITYTLTSDVPCLVDSSSNPLETDEETGCLLIPDSYDDRILVTEVSRLRREVTTLRNLLVGCCPALVCVPTDTGNWFVDFNSRYYKVCTTPPSSSSIAIGSTKTSNASWGHAGTIFIDLDYVQNTYLSPGQIFDIATRIGSATYDSARDHPNASQGTADTMNLPCLSPNSTGVTVFTPGQTSTTQLTLPSAWQTFWSGSTATLMNRYAIVPNGVPDAVCGNWYGFSKCIQGITVGKAYFIGIGADNFFKVEINGIQYVQSNMSPEAGFRPHYIFKYIATTDEITISMLAKNDINSCGMTGMYCVIFDTDINTLINAPTFNSIQQYVVFASFDPTTYTPYTITDGPTIGGVSYGLGCPDGTRINTCGSTPVCEQFIYYCDDLGVPTGKDCTTGYTLVVPPSTTT